MTRSADPRAQFTETTLGPPFGGARNPDCPLGTKCGAGELLAPLDLNVALHAIGFLALGPS